MFRNRVTCIRKTTHKIAIVYDVYKLMCRDFIFLFVLKTAKFLKTYRAFLLAVLGISSYNVNNNTNNLSPILQ